MSGRGRGQEDGDAELAAGCRSEHAPVNAVLAAAFGVFAAVGTAMPDATLDGIPAVKAWAERRLRDAEASFQRERMASPSDWAHEVVYQIVVDRFLL